MSIQNIVELVLTLAALALIIGRQVRWRRFNPGKAIRTPVVLAGIGLLTLVTGKQQAALTSLDLVLLGVELALAIAVGAVMGWLTVFRAAGDGGTEARTGWLGASLWFVLIAVRIGLDALAAAMGSHIAVSAGVILVMIGASRGASALVARSRAPHGALLSA